MAPKNNRDVAVGVGQWPKTALGLFEPKIRAEHGGPRSRYRAARFGDRNLLFECKICWHVFSARKS